MRSGGSIRVARKSVSSGVELDNLPAPALASMQEEGDVHAPQPDPESDPEPVPEPVAEPFAEPEAGPNQDLDEEPEQDMSPPPPPPKPPLPGLASPLLTGSFYARHSSPTTSKYTGFLTGPLASKPGPYRATMLQLYPEGRLVATYRRSDRSGAAEVASFCLTSKTSVERSQASRPLPPSADDSDSESSYRAAIQQKIGKKGSSGLSGKLSGKLFGSKPAALPVSTEITDALVVRLNDATGSFLELFPYSAASVESTLQVWEESAGSVIEKLREAGAAPSEPVTATSVLGEDDGGRESSTTEKLAALLGNKGILTAEDLGEVKRLMQRKSRAGESGTEPALISREEAVKREYLGGVGGGGEKKGSGR